MSEGAQKFLSLAFNNATKIEVARGFDPIVWEEVLSICSALLVGQTGLLSSSSSSLSSPFYPL
jgi:hypothetical protein